MKTKSRYKWAIFGLLLLVVPSINIVDVFPDFIAYFIFAGILSYGINKCPYFEEAHAAFMRLGIIGLIKIPVMLLVTWVRMGNPGDTDIFAMMTLIFGIIEVIYMIPAISAVFDALFYLGQRTDSSAVLKPIRFFGKSVDTGTLKQVCYFFTVARAVLGLLPELCLMSAEDKTGSNLVVHPYSHLYPFVFTICFTVSIIIGIVWFVMMQKYLRGIGNEGSYYSALDSMITAERRPEIERKLELRKMCMALNTLIVAAFFTLEINFDNFGNVNILPHFIFAIILVCGIRNLTGKTKLTGVASVICLLYSIVSLVGHGMLISFLNEWSYPEIERFDDAAAAYRPVIILSVAEFILAAALLVTVMLALRGFCLAKTKIPPTDEGYGIPDRDFHRSLFKKNVLYTVFGILVTLSKMVLVFLNSGADYINVGSIDGSISTIVATAVPWFGLMITILALLYAGSAFYFLGILKDELKMKYQ